MNNKIYIKKEANVVFFVAALFKTVLMKRNDTFLFGQTNQRFDFKIELQQGTSIDVVFDDAI